MALNLTGLQYNYDEILNDTYFQKFIAQKEIKQSTIDRYVRDLAFYSDSTHLTPTELIQQARTEIKEYEYKDDRQLETHLYTFLKYLKTERQFKDYTRKICLQTIKSFYRRFDINTDKVKLKAVPETYYLNIKQLPTQSDIREVIIESNRKYRALITHLGSSGMSLIDTQKLTLQDLVNAVNFNKTHINSIGDLYQINNKELGIVPAWDRRRNKSNMPYITFSSPESLTFLLDYLRWSPPSTSESLLFRGLKEGEFELNYSAIRSYFIYINDKLGWKDRRVGTAHYVTAKTMRTYFANMLEKAGVQEKFIRGMMGHTQKGIRQFYNKLDVDLLRDEYLKAIELLTFMEVPVVVDSTDEIVREQNERLKLQDREMRQLKELVLDIQREQQNKKQ